MDIQEKTFARHLFQNKVLKADGQAFEDIFTAIMSYSESDFRQIKPWGNIGDRKNDGYIKEKGIYFQVFAPEDIRKSYLAAIKKLKKDFEELKSQWSGINEFYFVVNDKHKGVNPDCEQTIQDIKKNHNLKKADFLTSKNLEDILFELDDDQIFIITGNIPDPASIKNIDYSTIKEVIDYIINLPLPFGAEAKIKLPDWERKIKFNGLSASVADLLNNGYLQLHSLEDYLANNSDFLADSLRDKMNEIYFHNKITKNGDELFWEIINTASPKIIQIYQIAVIVIMSKYFESCDIFKEPPENDEVS